MEDLAVRLGDDGVLRAARREERGRAVVVGAAEPLDNERRVARAHLELATRDEQRA